jgi:hypothetical protein
MVEGKTRKETVRLTAEALGVSIAQAGFIVAQELGEIEGDVITVDEAGNEVRTPDTVGTVKRGEVTWELMGDRSWRVTVGTERQPQLETALAARYRGDD